MFDAAWALEVRAACDPVFLAADAGFGWNPGAAGSGPPLLWEADPRRFAARYPDSDIEESYGSQWRQVHCIDYWVYVDEPSSMARLSVEGWSRPDESIELSGNGTRDGRVLAERFSEILRVSR